MYYKILIEAKKKKKQYVKIKSKGNLVLYINNEIINY